MPNERLDAVSPFVAQGDPRRPGEGTGEGIVKFGASGPDTRLKGSCM